MRPHCLIMEDAAILRGIVDLLEEAPATTKDVEMVQNVGHGTAKRLCQKLQQAGIIVHPTATREILGMQQRVPLLEWRLTAAYRLGEIDFDAEKLAMGPTVKQQSDHSPEELKRAEMEGF